MFTILPAYIYIICIVNRGLCQKSDFSKFYRPIMSLGSLMFAGVSGTFIKYDASRISWVAASFKKHARAEILSRANSFMIGTKHWTIQDDLNCDRQRNSVVLLSFTSCDSMSFACNDGICINFEDRCNGKIECGDGSDEIDCKVVHINSTYNKLLSPSQNKSVEILVQVKVKDIIKIDENSNEFRVKFKIYLYWNDYRLTFYNLKKKDKENRLSAEESSSIWKPEIYIEDIYKFHREINEEAVVLIQRNNDTYTTLDITNLHNERLFSGEENNLRMKETFRFLVYLFNKLRVKLCMFI